MKEQEMKVVIVNAQKITRKESGEVITKIGYMTMLEQTNNFVGYSLLEAWCNGDSFIKLKDFIGKEVNATIGLKTGKNSTLNAYIKKIDNITI